MNDSTRDVRTEEQIIYILMFVGNLLVILAFRMVDCIAKYNRDLPGRNVVANRKSAVTRNLRRWVKKLTWWSNLLSIPLVYEARSNSLIVKNHMWPPHWL